MGFDAMGVGDDDLSLGKEFLLELAKKARFPLLASNLVDGDSGKPLWPTYQLKEVNGLRLGLFSLLASEHFGGPMDPRMKGLEIKPHREAAQAMVKELQPRTDLIILVSHLGYPKDMELAQAVSGIHVIVGSHTGMNLTHPPVVQNTVLLQTAPRGMYVGKFDLTFLNQGKSFTSLSAKRSLEGTLKNVALRLSARQVSEPEKSRLKNIKKDAERKLQQFQGQNEFDNRIVALSDEIKEDLVIARLIAAYKAEFPETPNSPAPPEKPAASRR